jgi:hypothetical protein
VVRALAGQWRAQHNTMTSASFVNYNTAQYNDQRKLRQPQHNTIDIRRGFSDKQEVQLMVD